MDLDAYRRYKRYKRFRGLLDPESDANRQADSIMEDLDEEPSWMGLLRGSMTEAVVAAPARGLAGLGRLNQATKDAAEGDSFIDTAVSYAVRSNPAALGAMKLLELARPKALEAAEAGGLVAEQRIAGQTTSPVQSFREGGLGSALKTTAAGAIGQGPRMLADIATFGGISMATVGGEKLEENLDEGHGLGRSLGSAATAGAIVGSLERIGGGLATKMLPKASGSLLGRPIGWLQEKIAKGGLAGLGAAALAEGSTEVGEEALTVASDYLWSTMSDSTRSRIASGQIWEDLLDAGIIGAFAGSGADVLSGAGRSIEQRSRQMARVFLDAPVSDIDGVREGLEYGEIAPENLTIADGRVLNTEAAGKLDAHSPGRQWLAVNVDGLRPINEQQGPAAGDAIMKALRDSLWDTGGVVAHGGGTTYMVAFDASADPEAARQMVSDAFASNVDALGLDLPLKLRAATGEGLHGAMVGIGALRDTRRLAQVPFEQKDVAAKVLLEHKALYNREGYDRRAAAIGKAKSQAELDAALDYLEPPTVAALHGAIEGARVEAERKARAELARSREEDAKAQELEQKKRAETVFTQAELDALAAVEVPQGQEAPAPVPIEQAWQQAAQQVQVAAQDPGAAAAIAAEIGQDPADVAAALQELPAAAGVVEQELVERSEPEFETRRDGENLLGFRPRRMRQSLYAPDVVGDPAAEERAARVEVDIAAVAEPSIAMGAEAGLAEIRGAVMNQRAALRVALGAPPEGRVGSLRIREGKRRVVDARLVGEVETPSGMLKLSVKERIRGAFDPVKAMFGDFGADPIVVASVKGSPAAVNGIARMRAARAGTGVSLVTAIATADPELGAQAEAMLAADPEARPVVVTDVGEASSQRAKRWRNELDGQTSKTARAIRRLGKELVRRPQELMFFLSSARWDSVNENFRRNKELFEATFSNTAESVGGTPFARRATSANLRALPEEVRALPMEELRWLLKSRARRERAGISAQQAEVIRSYARNRAKARKILERPDRPMLPEGVEAEPDFEQQELALALEGEESLDRLLEARLKTGRDKKRVDTRTDGGALRGEPRGYGDILDEEVADVGADEFNRPTQWFTATRDLVEWRDDLDQFDGEGNGFALFVRDGKSMVPVARWSRESGITDVHPQVAGGGAQSVMALSDDAVEVARRSIDLTLEAAGEIAPFGEQSADATEIDADPELKELDDKPQGSVRIVVMGPTAAVSPALSGVDKARLSKLRGDLVRSMGPQAAAKWTSRALSEEGMLGNFGKRAAWKGEYAELLRREAAARGETGKAVNPADSAKLARVFDSLLPASVFPSRLSVAASDAVGAEFAETFRALVDTGGGAKRDLLDDRDAEEIEASQELGLKTSSFVASKGAPITVGRHEARSGKAMRQHGEVFVFIAPPDGNLDREQTETLVEAQRIGAPFLVLDSNAGVLHSSNMFRANTTADALRERMDRIEALLGVMETAEDKTGRWVERKAKLQLRLAELGALEAETRELKEGAAQQEHAEAARRGEANRVAEKDLASAVGEGGVVWAAVAHLAGVQVADRLVAATSPYSSVAHAASRMVARVAGRVHKAVSETRLRPDEAAWALDGLGAILRGFAAAEQARTQVGSKSVDLIAMAQDIKTLRYGGSVNFSGRPWAEPVAQWGAKAEVAEVEAFHAFAQAHASANEVGVLPSAMVEQSIEEIVKAHIVNAAELDVGPSADTAVFSVALAAAAASGLVGTEVSSPQMLGALALPGGPLGKMVARLIAKAKGKRVASHIFAPAQAPTPQPGAAHLGLATLLGLKRGLVSGASSMKAGGLTALQNLTLGVASKSTLGEGAWQALAREDSEVRELTRPMGAIVSQIDTAIQAGIDRTGKGNPEVIQKLFLRELKRGAKFKHTAWKGFGELVVVGQAMRGEIDAASKKLLGMLPKLPESLAKSILQNLGTYTRVVYDRIGDKRWIEAHAPSLTNPVGSLLWDQAAQEIEETLGDQWGPAGSLKRRQQANEVLRNTLMGAPQGVLSIEQERARVANGAAVNRGVFESLGDLGPSTRQLLGVSSDPARVGFATIERIYKSLARIQSIQELVSSGVITKESRRPTDPGFEVQVTAKSLGIPPEAALALFPGNETDGHQSPGVVRGSSVFVDSNAVIRDPGLAALLKRNGVAIGKSVVSQSFRVVQSNGPMVTLRAEEGWTVPVPASELRDMNGRAIVGSDVVVGYMAAEHMETVRELLNRDPSNGSGKMRLLLALSGRFTSAVTRERAFSIARNWSSEWIDAAWLGYLVPPDAFRVVASSMKSKAARAFARAPESGTEEYLLGEALRRGALSGARGSAAYENIPTVGAALEAFAQSSGQVVSGLGQRALELWRKSGASRAGKIGAEFLETHYDAWDLADAATRFAIFKTEYGMPYRQEMTEEQKLRQAEIYTMMKPQYGAPYKWFYKTRNATRGAIGPLMTFQVESIRSGAFAAAMALWEATGLESLKPHPELIHGGPAMKKRGLARMATQLGSLGQNLIAAGAMTTAAAMLYGSTDDEEKPEVESVAYVLGDWARAEADSMVLLPADAGKSRYMAVSFLDYRRNFWLPVRKVIGAAWNRMHSGLPVDEQELQQGFAAAIAEAVGDFAKGFIEPDLWVRRGIEAITLERIGGGSITAATDPFDRALARLWHVASGALPGTLMDLNLTAEAMVGRAAERAEEAGDETSLALKVADMGYQPRFGATSERTVGDFLLTASSGMRVVTLDLHKQYRKKAGVIQDRVSAVQREWREFEQSAHTAAKADRVFEKQQQKGERLWAESLEFTQRAYGAGFSTDEVDDLLKSAGWSTQEERDALILGQPFYHFRLPKLGGGYY